MAFLRPRLDPARGPPQFHRRPGRRGYRRPDATRGVSWSRTCARMASSPRGESARSRRVLPAAQAPHGQAAALSQAGQGRDAGRDAHPEDYQRSDSFPVPSTLGPAVVQSSDFGNDPRALGRFDNGDGGQVAFLGPDTASFGVTMGLAASGAASPSSGHPAQPSHGRWPAAGSGRRLCRSGRGSSASGSTGCAATTRSGRCFPGLQAGYDFLRRRSASTVAVPIGRRSLVPDGGHDVLAGVRIFPMSVVSASS